MTNQEFLGRRILVTGATGGGVGSSVAGLLANAGCVVYVNARTQDAVSEFISRQPKKLDFRAAPGDLGSKVGLAQLIESLPADIDTIILNAATSYPHYPLDQYPEEQWTAEVFTMLTSALEICKAVLPGMSRRKFGRIVAVTSSAAERGTWGRGAGYTVAKSGLEGLMRQAALEYGQHGITANSVSPSQIDTPRARRGGRKSDAALSAYAEQLVPAGRVGSPIDVAGTCLFLSSVSASYVNGQTIRVNGGSNLASRLSRAKG
jgi:3-oxoacyl-[acyl-carrier protein] reductase